MARIMNVTLKLRLEDDANPADWNWLDLLDVTPGEFLGVVRIEVLESGLPASEKTPNTKRSRK